jgi:hypothetical protein
MKPVHDSDRERFPELKADIGEDPARFLDRPFFSNGAGSSPLLLARARIRGIDSLATLRAWIAVERNLDRGPRDRIIDLLEERQATLEEIGERPDRLDFQDDRDGRDVETIYEFYDRDGNRLDDDRSMASAPSRRESTRELATDGGEP